MSNKLETLFKYSNPQIKSTWRAMGENKITPNTTVYSRDIVYKLSGFEIPDGKLEKSINDYVLFCNKEYIGKPSWNWEALDILDYGTGEISFGNNIISPYFTLLLTGEEFREAPFETSEDFIPFKDGETTDGNPRVIITDDDYDLCIRCLGAPFVTDEELEYSREDITNLAIKPALERYFKYFPKTEIVTEGITGKEQFLEFPKGAYDVIHFNVQQRGASGAGVINNPLLRFWDEGMMSGGFGASINGHYHGTYAPKTQTNTFESMALGRAAQQAVVNYRTRYHLDKMQKMVYPADATPEQLNDSNWCRLNGEKKWFLRFYSNKGGTAEIHFAIQTLDFNDVEFARRPELITLCNAEVKRLFGNLRRQVKSNIPGIVDYSNWVTEANEEIKEVEENWKSIVKYSSIIRGSL